MRKSEKLKERAKENKREGDRYGFINDKKSETDKQYLFRSFFAIKTRHANTFHNIY